MFSKMKYLQINRIFRQSNILKIPYLGQNCTIGWKVNVLDRCPSSYLFTSWCYESTDPYDIDSSSNLCVRSLSVNFRVIFTVWQDGQNIWYRMQGHKERSKCDTFESVKMSQTECKQEINETVSHTCAASIFAGSSVSRDVTLRTNDWWIFSK